MAYRCTVFSLAILFILKYKIDVSKIFQGPHTLQERATQGVSFPRMLKTFQRSTYQPGKLLCLHSYRRTCLVRDAKSPRRHKFICRVPQALILDAKPGRQQQLLNPPNSSLLTASEENYTLTLLLSRSVTGIDVNCKAKQMQLQ